MTITEKQFSVRQRRHELVLKFSHLNWCNERGLTHLRNNAADLSHGLVWGTLLLTEAIDKAAAEDVDAEELASWEKRHQPQVKPLANCGWLRDMCMDDYYDGRKLVHG
jgi:hypothetical protein